MPVWRDVLHDSFLIACIALASRRAAAACLLAAFWSVDAICPGERFISIPLEEGLPYHALCIGNRRDGNQLRNGRWSDENLPRSIRPSPSGRYYPGQGRSTRP